MDLDQLASDMFRECKKVWILISWLLRSQLFWIYTVFKTGIYVYLGKCWASANTLIYPNNLSLRAGQRPLDGRFSAGFIYQGCKLLSNSVCHEMVEYGPCLRKPDFSAHEPTRDLHSLIRPMLFSLSEKYDS